MKSLWDEVEASRYVGDLAQRVYSSRLLGRDPSLVLHGGGNTSVKARIRDIFGEEHDILYVKGRGRDLATLDESGFTPCRLQHLLRLAHLDALTDEEMERELKLSSMNPAAPPPSVETLLHAILPARFVDHTHSDALIAVMNTPSGSARVKDLYGDRAIIVPYAMPGFRLARICKELVEGAARDTAIGMILMHHGIFTFGETARSAYERMIELVDRAEQYLNERGAWNIEWPQPPQRPRVPRSEIAELRRAVSSATGLPLIMSTHTDAQTVGFARRSDVSNIAGRGGVTPDHVIRTKRTPLVGRDVASYCRDYEQYVCAHSKGGPVSSVDPAPRVILDPELGLCALGKTAVDAAIAEDIYRHTIDIIVRAEKLESWRALPPKDFFEVEFWDMERAKLRNQNSALPFIGEIALVTGAASGIGKACVAALLARGAAVVGLDLSPSVVQLHSRQDYLGIQCDLTDEAQIDAALDQIVRKFGGLDMLVLNAGIFPKSAAIAALPTDIWRRVLSINLDSNLILMRECHPFLKLALRGGRVAIIGSKNVPAPGPGVASYSASKAALQQLARVAALEWGSDRIRVNTVHPNAVFDTGIWTPEVLAARAASYGLTVEEYKTHNILKVEVTSWDVAEMVAELCGPRFARTTGAQVPIDGGNDRVI